ncbi:SDC2 family protein [Megaselia abdita]
MRNIPEKNNLTKWKLTTFYIFIVSFALTAGAIDESVSSPLPTSATSSKQSSTSLAPSSSSTYSTNEEIYIDDDPNGSGHGGIHDDLDKNSDYSGSGFGPDDEDSIGNNNSRNNNNKYHKQPSETGGTYSSNKYNNIGVGGNNNNNNAESSNKDITINNNNEVVPGEEIGRTNLNPPGGVNPGPNEVLIMNEERTTSFFAQPGILAAVIGGAVVGLLCAILVVMFIVYRMRKKDEGSYALDEPKRSPAVNSYAKNGNNREFYA